MLEWGKGCELCTCVKATYIYILISNSTLLKGADEHNPNINEVYKRDPNWKKKNNKKSEKLEKYKVLYVVVHI